MRPFLGLYFAIFLFVGTAIFTVIPAFLSLFKNAAT